MEKKEKTKFIKKIEKTGKAIKKASAKKIKPTFKKPKVKLEKYSAEKFVKQLGEQQGALVREIENRYANPPQDNRSLYFKEEWKNEKKKAFGGFL